MNSALRCSLAALAVALFGCSSSPPPPAKSAPAPSAAGETSGSEASEAPSAAEASGPASPASGAESEKKANAKIIEISPSSESVPYSRVKIVFQNPTTHECSVDGYTLTWDGGKKHIEKGFPLPAGATRQRSMRVEPNDGKLGSLNQQSAKIELQTNCPH